MSLDVDSRDLTFVSASSFGKLNNSGAAQRTAPPRLEERKGVPRTSSMIVDRPKSLKQARSSRSIKTFICIENQYIRGIIDEMCTYTC